MISDFPANEEHQVGGYVLGRAIGQGAYAQVRLARHILTNTVVAVKISKQKAFPMMSQEAPCLTSLNHPNIIKLFEIITTEHQTYYFMEHVPRGHLKNYLDIYGPLAEEEARVLFRQMLSSVQYCHGKGIAHRDLKPENMLLDDHFNIKLADFGFSTKFSGNKLRTFCGTVSYMAPEILLLQPYEGPKVDTWSLGVILYRMLTGKLPFDKENFEEKKQQIVDGQYCVPDFMSEQGKDIIKKLLTVDPSERPLTEDVMRHPWVTGGQDEELQPYVEPPEGDIDPLIIQTMENLGFKKEEIEESVSQRKCDKMMGTYMILQNAKNRMVGRTIKVRPCPSSDHSNRLSTTQEDQALGLRLRVPASGPPTLKARWPSGPPRLQTQAFVTSSVDEGTVNTETKLTIPPSCLWPISTYKGSLKLARATTHLPSLELGAATTSPESTSASPSPESRTTTPSPESRTATPSPESRTATPGPESRTATPGPESRTATPGPESRTATPGPESRTATPGPESRTATPGPESRTATPGPESRTATPSPAFPCGPGASSITRGGSSSGSRLQAAQLDTQDSTSNPRHGWRRTARRVLGFFLKCMCCGASTNKRHHKKTRVQPM